MNAAARLTTSPTAWVNGVTNSKILLMIRAALGLTLKATTVGAAQAMLAIAHKAVPMQIEKQRGRFFKAVRF